MKKILYFLFTFFLICGLSAQTDQGSMLLGANTSFNMQTFPVGGDKALGPEGYDLGYTIDGDEPDWWEPYEPKVTTTTAN